MKLQTNGYHAETSGSIDQSTFGISQDDTGHIISILRDKLYSDKIMAVLREYGANAVDANVESGQKSRPIKIRLPDAYDSSLSIRDFGFGLNPNQIKQVYTQYGASTKRESNSSIGQLGLGSKSGFAYDEQFTIISRYNGDDGARYKDTYTAYIDDRNIGSCDLFEHIETDEETGIEIIIQVRSADRHWFVQKAKECYAFFEPLPDINTDFPVKTYALQGPWWRLPSAARSSGSKAIMGCIAYPINLDKLNCTDSNLQNILNSGFEIRFQIGELSIAANREELEYTRLTKSAIISRAQAIFDQVKETVSKSFANAKTVWEARMLYSKMSSASGAFNELRRMLSELAYWNNIKISSLDTTLISTSVGTFDGTNGKLGLVHKGRKNFERNPCYRAYGTAFELRDSTAIYVADVKNGYWPRLAQNQENNTTLMFNPVLLEDGKTWNIQPLYDWIDQVGITGIPIKFLSKLPYDPAKATANSPIDRTITALKVFTLKEKAVGGANSNEWAPADIDQAEGSGIYCVIHRFQVEDGTDVYSMRKKIQLLKEIGFPHDIQVVGVKKAEASKMGPGWIKFEDWYVKAYEETLTSSGLLQDAADYAALEKYFRLYSNVDHFTNKIEISKQELPVDHCVRVFFERLVKGEDRLNNLKNHPKFHLLRKLWQSDDTNLVSEYDIEVYKTLITNMYPIFKVTDFLSCYIAEEEFIYDIINYVKLVDTSNIGESI